MKSTVVIYGWGYIASLYVVPRDGEGRRIRSRLFDNIKDKLISFFVIDRKACRHICSCGIMVYDLKSVVVQSFNFQLSGSGIFLDIEPARMAHKIELP
ncbi:hypothetical protein D9M72_428950 [compost metagenome]